MKVAISVVATRDDGTVLSREVRAERRVSRYYRDGAQKNETKDEFRARVESMVTASLNATVGR